MALAARRLPGIEVDVAPLPPAEALPRMDVAVFVGFAAMGPIHRPVVVESVPQFAAIFGRDAPLAWDQARGERVYAYLGPAVRAFFSNGGRRCWVIRVARTAASEALRLETARSEGETRQVARPNTFAVPGLLFVPGETGTAQAAMAEARCEGSWSDELRVATALTRRSFGLEVLPPSSSPSSPPTNRFALRTRFGLRVGDLIELAGGEVSAYAIVESVGMSPEPNGPHIVEASVCAAFERLVEETSPASPAVKRVGTAHVDALGIAVQATLSLPTPKRPARVRFHEPVPASVERGHWVSWTDAGETVWLRIDDLDREPEFSGSPPVGSSSRVKASVTGVAWRDMTGVPVDLLSLRGGHLLTLEIQVTGGGRNARMTDVGLTPRHANAWWNHVSDAAFYAPPDEHGPPGPRVSPSDVRTEVERFPLSRSAKDQTPVAWIPLGVGPLFGPALAPLPQGTTALERDGLATFDAELFIDPDLATTSMRGLPDLADRIRFLQPKPRPQLFGMHGALSVGAGGLFNEASLLAIPDAIHLGWRSRKDASVADPDPRPMPQPPHWLTHRGGCPPREAESSETLLEGPDPGVFLDCGTRALTAPMLEQPPGPIPPGALRLQWSPSDAGAEYVLVEATRPDFSDAREISRSDETEYITHVQREGVYYYQVFAQLGQDRSAGSAIVVRVRSDDWVQNAAVDADRRLEHDWLAIHRAALRLAGGSGELFVALALPRHFRAPQAVRYTQRLQAVRQPPGEADANAFGFDEIRALSYGAVYLPWLQSDVRPSDLRSPIGAAVALEQARTGPATVVPPDGAALGILAARATSRGAWVAAANEPLTDIVAVTPVIPALDWQRLQDTQINLVRADPRGFLVLSADTLSPESEVRLINVRRLLTLLRRLALRRGTSYVFEPNGSTLRRAVQRGFEILLTDMFRRGAFSGTSPAQSFRVVTDDTINTPRDVEAGRLIVELRVAPSVPTRFIAVRLAQSGGRLTVTEEL